MQKRLRKGKRKEKDQGGLTFTTHGIGEFPWHEVMERRTMKENWNKINASRCIELEKFASSRFYSDQSREIGMCGRKSGGKTERGGKNKDGMKAPPRRGCKPRITIANVIAPRYFTWTRVRMGKVSAVSALFSFRWSPVRATPGPVVRMNCNTRETTP